MNGLIWLMFKWCCCICWSLCICCYCAAGTTLSAPNASNLAIIKEEILLEPPATNTAAVFIEYFRYHGVHSLIVIVCNNDIDTQAKQRELQILMRHFIANGFYVRIFSGHDYSDASTNDFTNNKTAPPPNTPTSSTFGPPITFRSDNATKRPLRLQLQPLSHKSGIVMLQFATSCALNVLRWSAASEHNFFTTNRFWLLVTNVTKNIELLNDKDIFLPPDSEVRVMVQVELATASAAAANSTEFSLIDVYKVAAERPVKQRVVCAQCQSVAEMLNALQLFGSAISFRQDLEGISFKTGLVIAFPDLFSDIEDLSLRHIDTISKVNNRLTIELANKLNLSFNTHQTDNYGWHKPNGSFDGLMGRFQRYELDFAQCAIFMRLDRIALVDFVAETFRIRAGIMFRQPPLSAVANIFAMPFDTDVWISILLLMIFTAFVLGIELTFSPHTHKMDFLDCIVFIWGAMCQQGFYVSIFNRSARIIVFTTFVVTLFLYTSFSANIVALLQSPSEAIHSLSDLTQSPLEIGVQDTVYNKIYFNESTDPITNHLYHKKIAPKGESVFMRPLIGMEKMRTKLFAYQIELQAGYQIISDTFSEPEKCGLMELEPFQLPMIAIPTRKNFPYKELFRRQLRWQREVGLMNREELKWFPQKPKCEGGVGGFVSIGITECRYALGMFGFGILLGAFMLCLELSFNYCIGIVKKMKRNNKFNILN